MKNVSQFFAAAAAFVHVGPAFDGKHRRARVQRFQSKHHRSRRAKMKRKRKQAKWSRVHT